jgi:hypothetical protein
LLAILSDPCFTVTGIFHSKKKLGDLALLPIHLIQLSWIFKSLHAREKRGVGCCSILPHEAGGGSGRRRKREDGGKVGNIAKETGYACDPGIPIDT